MRTCLCISASYPPEEAALFFRGDGSKAWQLREIALQVTWSSDVSANCVGGLLFLGLVFMGVCFSWVFFRVYALYTRVLG